MKLWIFVKPNSRKEGIQRFPDGSYRVSVRVPAYEGRANEAIIEILADFFSVPKSRIRIVSGARGRRKLIEIP